MNRRPCRASRYAKRPLVEPLESRNLLSTTPIQVVFLVGQSNMDGAPNVADLRAPYDAPQSDVWIWQDDLGPNVGWTAVRGGFGGDGNKGSGGNGSQFGPEVSLGRALADAVPETQFAVIKHVQAGTGATMQDGWNPDRGGGAGPGQIWIDFMAKTHEALAALTASQLEYEIAGLFVSQGTRDEVSETGVEAANYEQNFTDFISAVRQEFGVPQLPVVFAETVDTRQGSTWHDGWVLVRNAQAAVDDADPFATMIQVDDLSRLDQGHHDADGQIAQGKRFANAYLGAPYEGSAKAGTDGFEAGNFTGGSEQWSAGAWTVAGDASVTTANAPHQGTRHALLRNSTGDLIRAAATTGLTNLKLRFWAKFDSFESGDKALVKVSADGVNWATLREFVDGEDDNTYRFYEIDVPNLGNTTYVRFDAQMNQSADNWYLDDVQLTGTTNGLPLAELPNKFYVADDAAGDRTYEYGAAGAWVDDYSLAAGNAAPRGAASTAAGNRVWVVDQNRNVYVYDNTGLLLGLWSAGSLAANAVVEGIATNGTDVWIVDANSDKVFRYTGAASRLTDSQNAASSFSLNSGNKNPKDIVTDGTSLWVVNDAANDKVFKYNLSGTLLGSWTITAGGGSPTGITLDPSAPAHLWVVDSASDRVYQYDNAVSRTSGSQAASASFALASANTNPQGIADPPAPGLSTPAPAPLAAYLPASTSVNAMAPSGPPTVAAFPSRAAPDVIWPLWAGELPMRPGEPSLGPTLFGALAVASDRAGPPGISSGGSNPGDRQARFTPGRSHAAGSDPGAADRWDGVLADEARPTCGARDALFALLGEDPLRKEGTDHWFAP